MVFSSSKPFTRRASVQMSAIDDLQIKRICLSLDAIDPENKEVELSNENNKSYKLLILYNGDNHKYLIICNRYLLLLCKSENK